MARGPRRIKRRRRKPGDIQGLLARASEFQRNGDLDQARRLFEQALRMRPDWPPLLNALGTVFMDMGEYKGAKACFRKASMSSVPYPPALYNMARLCHMSGDLTGAVKYYRQAVDAEPGMAMAWNNLGLLLMDSGQAQQAVSCFEKATEAAPDSGEAWNNLGLALEDMERFRDAVAAFQKAISLHPGHISALFNLGALELRLGNRNEAAGLLEKVLDLDSNNESARYLLQGLGRLPAPEAAPVGHVKKVFDDCAEKFEQVLVRRLQYRTPEALYQLVSPHLGSGLNILDLGCGTGLGADLYRPHAALLAGMDASERMLGVAERKNIYDRLFCADILSPWDLDGLLFHLIYSSDVFVYFGSLDTVLAEMHRNVAAEGVVAFSVEILNSSSQPFMLQESGRFAHSPAYVMDRVAAAGFYFVDSAETVLRKEQGEDVQGLLVVAKRR